MNLAIRSVRAAVAAAALSLAGALPALAETILIHAGPVVDSPANAVRGATTITDTDGIEAQLQGVTLSPTREAGVDSIEHGTILDPETIDAFAASGAYYVPTLSTVNGYIERMATNPDAYAANLLGASDEAGTLEAGKSADLIAVDGNPLEDVTAMKSVNFVMIRVVVAKE